jgi:hypothetical protein
MRQAFRPHIGRKILVRVPVALWLVAVLFLFLLLLFLFLLVTVVRVVRHRWQLLVGKQKKSENMMVLAYYFVLFIYRAFWGFRAKCVFPL